MKSFFVLYLYRCYTVVLTLSVFSEFLLRNTVASIIHHGISVCGIVMRKDHPIIRIPHSNFSLLLVSVHKTIRQTQLSKILSRRKLVMISISAFRKRSPIWSDRFLAVLSLDSVIHLIQLRYTYHVDYLYKIMRLPLIVPSFSWFLKLSYWAVRSAWFKV